MKENKILSRIYPSVVTYGGNWQKMLKEVKQLKLKKISLFLTAAGIRERQRIYQALKDSSVVQIPHVHLRHDMKEEELDFFVSCYQTKAFTTHFQYLNFFENSKHKKKIFVEINNGQARIKNLKALGQVGGVCIDLAHLEQFRRRDKRYYKIAEPAAKNCQVGCNHLSAVLANGLSWHYAKDVSQLDYVADIPKFYFSPYINIELINPISEQLKFKKYLAEILAKKWNKKS